MDSRDEVANDSSDLSQLGALWVIFLLRCIGCRNREGQRGREAETQRDRDAERQRDRETERQKSIERERQIDRVTERQRDRETEDWITASEINQFSLKI